DATACKGCGTYGDMDLAETDNLNDCPELLDLAHAHGITPDILASLDRPTPPEAKPRDGRRLGLGDILATPPITTADVPAALRGPNWQPYRDSSPRHSPIHAQLRQRNDGSRYRREGCPERRRQRVPLPRRERPNRRRRPRQKRPQHHARRGAHGGDRLMA